MLLIKPSFEILSIMCGMNPLEHIEKAGRICYKSEDKITPDSSKQFCQNLTKLGHESVIEHSAMSVKFVIDRGVSHELVRHRLCAFSQESTRYCNYKGGVTFIIPPWVNIKQCEIPLHSKERSLEIYYNDADGRWLYSMAAAEKYYDDLLFLGWSPQQARSVLPNSLKTEIVVTANFREWRHIFKLRTAKASHPQMREVMVPLLKETRKYVPVIFDGILKED